MPKHSITREMRYSARQLFDIAADVDNYRKFVPLVKVSRSYDVRSGEAGTKLFKGELVIRYPKLGIEERVISDVVADPGRLIVSSRATEGAVEHLESSWKFQERRDGGCDVEFTIDYKLKRRAIQFLMSGMFDLIVRKINAAFEARALQLYGPPSESRRAPASSS
jgi:coenzyme Q-binding protein COQ10